MRSIGLSHLVIALIAVAGCNAAVPPTAPNAMLVPPEMALPPGGTVVSAEWRGVGHTARGTVRLTVAGSVAQLDFSENFAVSGVPGPFVYLNTTNNPNTGRPLRVSALRSNSGAQSYAFQLPAGVIYQWVLVWCDPFNVPVAEARLPSVP